MTKFDQAISPQETSRARLVSKEDVGHGAASAARNDGYARRSKLRVVKSDNGSGMRKTDTGEVSGEDDSAEDEDDQEQTESDVDATENEDPNDYTPSASRFLTRQDSNISAFTDASSINDEAGLRPVSNGTKRKRTTSELSVGTILSTIEQDDDNDEVEYPRKRMSRRLSNEHGLLKYDQRVIEVDEDIDVAEYSKAIESSSEDELMLQESDSDVDDDPNDDSDDDEDDDGGDLDDSFVEEEEEALIIEEEDARLEFGTAASSVVGAESDIDLPSDLDLGFLNSEMDDVFNAGESFFFRGLDSDHETPRRKRSDASARRVRFQDEIDIAHNTYTASTTSTETDIDIFPDLLDNPFKSREELPANVRSQIEDEDDGEVGHGASSDGEGSVWDFGEEKASENFFSWHDEAGSDSDDNNGSDSDLSGYDSDGDTTDDDLPPPSTIRAPRSLLHSRTSSTVTEIATPKPFPRSRRSRRGPIMGSFIVDENKAMAFIDPNTKQLRIQPARASFIDPFNSTASSVNNSPQVNFSGLAYDSDNSDLRLITGPSDVMMSGVFGGMPGQRYEDGRFVMEANSGPLLIGPPEAFYPFTAIRSDGTPEEEDGYSTEDEYEGDHDIFTTFLDVDEDDDEEPDLFDEEITSPTTTDAPDSTPAGPRTMSQMLHHLDRGVVSSFRNNQDRHRHTSKLPHDFTQDSTPIRDGRTADDVMTPLRKRKGGGILKKTPRRPMMGSFA